MTNVASKSQVVQNSKMQCKQHTSLEEFLTSVSEELYQDELEHAMILGNMNNAKPEQTGLVMFSVRDANQKLVLVAFTSNPILMLSGKNLSAVDCFFEHLKTNKSDLFHRWIGPDALAKRLFDLMIADGRKVSLFRETTMYALSEGNIVKEAPDKNDLDFHFRSDQRMVLATALDLEGVTNWCQLFWQDVNEAISVQEAQDKMNHLIDNNSCFLWMRETQPTDVDNNNQFPTLTPLSMTCKNRETRKTASITMVFTPEELRGKGYAKKLVKSVCKFFFQTRGKEYVTLFADNANPISTKMYISLGFQPLGKWTDYSVDRK